MHDAAHEALAVGAHRQDVAILALRVEPVLQVRRVLLVGEHRAHPAIELRLDRGERATQRPERIARVIDEPPVLVERLEDRMEDVTEIRDRLTADGKPRRDVIVLAQVSTQA